MQLAEVGVPMMAMSFGARNDRSDDEYQLGNVVRAYDRGLAYLESHGWELPPGVKRETAS